MSAETSYGYKPGLMSPAPGAYGGDVVLPDQFTGARQLGVGAEIIHADLGGNKTSIISLVDDKKDIIPLPGAIVAVSRSDNSNPGVRRAAQYLCTSVYLENGYVRDGELNRAGLYIDEYDPRSTYFLAENGHKITTARQIRAIKRDGIISLPTVRNFALDPDILAEVAGVKNLVDLKSYEVVEISGLASDKKEGGVLGGFDATLSIYGAMLRVAIEQGQKLWIQNTTPKVLAQLRFLIGDEQVREIGQPDMYMGSVTIPIAINPQSVVRLLLGSTDPNYDLHKTYLKEVFKGIDAREAPADIRNTLAANGIEHKKPSLPYKIVRSPKAIAISGLMAYAAARAIPLGELDEFMGEAAIFFGIDVATVAPYVWGLSKMYDSKASIGKKAVGAAIALPSLIAPYAYMYAEGEGYPPYVNVLVGTLISGAIIKDVITRIRTARREQAIREELARPKQSHGAPSK